MLLLECSFLFPEDRDRAREYAHIHLDDILARVERFENEAVVLTHFSQRYSPEEIREALRAIPQLAEEGFASILVLGSTQAATVRIG